MRWLTTDILTKYFEMLGDVKLPGDLFIGIDTNPQGGIYVETLQKTLQGFHRVASRCYELTEEDLERKDIQKFFTSAVFIALIRPIHATHYVLSVDGQDKSLGFGGDDIYTLENVQATRFRLSETAELIEFGRADNAQNLKTAIPQNWFRPLGRLAALSQLTITYPVANAVINTPASEGSWHLHLGDPETSLVVIENPTLFDTVTDKYGRSIQELYNLPIKDAQLAAYGAALSLYQARPAIINPNGQQQIKLPEPYFIRHLSFRGILFTGFLTLVLYGLIAAVGYYYSNEKERLERRSLSVAEQKVELAELRQINRDLKSQIAILDSLSTPASFFAVQLLLITEVLPEKLWLSRVSSEQDNGGWSISGYAWEDSRVAQLLSNLQRLDFVAGIELKQLLNRSEFRHTIKRENRHKGTVYFEVFIAIL